MAASQRTSIPAELRRLFPTRWLNATAREAGLVVRRRKVAPAAFFWTLVRLGFAIGHRRSLASLRRFFQASTGVGLVSSSFYDRFTPGTVRFLRRALARAAERLGQPSGPLRGLGTIRSHRHQPKGGYGVGHGPRGEAAAPRP